ncbi:MAG TPA: glycosyltransferase family 4 protein [Acidisarcina sp.]
MDKPLRVGFVSINDPNDVNQWSGIPYNVLQAMRTLGVRVEVYAPLSTRAKFLLSPAKALARLRHTGISLDHYPLMLNSYARQISKMIAERPVDVIFAPSSIPITALQCSQPIIFWTDAVFHSMYGYYEGSFSGKPGAVARGRRQEEAGLGNATFAVYASEWAAKSARQLTDPAKVAVLPFGASLTVDHSRSDVEVWARARREQRPRSCELLFFGVDWERKGGPIAIETAGLLNALGIPAHLTVVGSQPPTPLPDYVSALGFIDKASPEGVERIKSLLRESDFLILPSRAEAAGIVFCEASAFGLPSISYATGGVPDYVRNDVNGVCLAVGTPAAGFAEAIRDLLSDRARYAALCVSAFREYETRLNWKTSVSGLIDLCRRSLAP